MKWFKKLILWGIIFGIAYMLLSYHFIFFGRKVKLLKKTRYTLDYTFYSATNKSPEKILEEDDLREDGIGDILLEMGLIDEEKLNRILEEYKMEEY